MKNKKLTEESPLKIGDNWLKPQKGRILISEPFAGDFVFKKSVVYIVEHSEQQTMGFILNKPVDMDKNPFFKIIGLLPYELSFGGPVGMNRILYLHTLDSETIPGSKEIFDGIFLGGNYKSVLKLVESGKIGEKDVRFFLGCAVWSPKQLEREIASKFWIVGNLPKDKIMDYNGDVWASAVKQLGGRYKLWEDLPSNPMWN